MLDHRKRLLFISDQQHGQGYVYTPSPPRGRGRPLKLLNDTPSPLSQICVKEICFLMLDGVNFHFSQTFFYTLPISKS